MDTRFRVIGLRASAALVVAICALSAASSASARFTRAVKGTRYAKVSRVCPAPKPGHATCLALARVPVPAAAAEDPGIRPYKAAAGALESGPDGLGLTPADLASAYGYDPNAGGSGQTIAIVDAYDDPNIEGDLAAFDAEYDLASCTHANGCFTKVSQSGSTTALPEADTTGWSVEISLDVEMAHSACPKCKILLLEAEDSSFQNLAAAVHEAGVLGASEVSNSYGGPEGEVGAIEKSAYNQPGVVIAAAAGDWGYDGWAELNRRKKPPGVPNLPAALPTVVAVGGTTLELNEHAKRVNETVWNGNGPANDGQFVEGATGGGCSTLFAAQPWQQATPGYLAADCNSKRLVADVSADANPYSGLEIYDTYNCGEGCEADGAGSGWSTIGGTSLSTPLISALYALAGGSSGVSYPALTLYGHLGETSSLYDVTEGGNGYCDAAPESQCGHPDAFGAVVSGYALQLDCEYTSACDAAPGFDGPSGVGTPNGLSLFEARLPTAAMTPPGPLKVGDMSSFNADSSSDPYPGATLSYSWSWGDGTPDSTGAAATHTYAAPGEFTVTLTVSDSYGLKSAPVTAVVAVAEKSAQEIAAEHEAKETQERQEVRQRQEAKETREVKEAREAKEALEAKEMREAAEAKEAREAQEGREAAAANKRHEEEVAAKSSVNAGQGVNGFRVSVAPGGPDVTLVGNSFQVTSAGAVTLKVSCPSGQSSCSGAITLRTLVAVAAAGAHVGAPVRSALTLAAGSFKVAGGKLVAVTLHLTAKARTLLARAHTLRVRATLLAHNPQGAGHTTLAIVTLRAAKAPTRKG